MISPFRLIRLLSPIAGIQLRLSSAGVKFGQLLALVALTTICAPSASAEDDPESVNQLSADFAPDVQLAPFTVNGERLSISITPGPSATSATPRNSRKKSSRSLTRRWNPEPEQDW
ncbi:MAG: hypothetical protein J6386_10970 [Candidatus Synoicihabitans palmerolidicus]|nr:hypothetical protein [Candidatus Synoicihabitans palmerolidicus]